MADQDDSEKTEEPSSKKLEDAHKKGDMAKSQEVNTWFILLAGAIIIGFSAPSMATELMKNLRVFLENPHAISTDPEHLRLIWYEAGQILMLCLAIPFGAIMIAGVVGNLVQNPPTFTTETIQPKFSKISPLGGAKRMFSGKSLMNFVKGILKIALVGLATFAIVYPQRDQLGLMVSIDLHDLLPIIHSMAIKILGAVIVIMGVIAAADYMYERHVWMQKQRMTMQEVKDEHKQAEGDPMVKAKLRALRRQRGQKRMMAAVPDATVVVTNPTHFAVALKYEQGMLAPICVAKGMDDVALTIRGIATEHNIPIIENKPLARALYAQIEIDEPIPAEHFQAVAEVVGYVMRLRAKMAWRS